MLSELVAFVAVSVLVIVTPGPDTLLTIRNTLSDGRRAGVFTAIGVSAGQACWTVAASVGVAALLVASEPAFRALKFFGAAYLIYLGAHSLWAALRRRRPDASLPDRSSLAPNRALRQGLISNLGNPKMAVFFTSLLPQFAPGGDASFGIFLGLGLLFCAMTLAWLAGYAVAVARAGDFLQRSGIQRALDAVAGTVLVALGLRVAVEKR